VGTRSAERVVGVLTWQPTKGVPEVDVCGLTELGNSRERHMAHNLDRFRPRGAYYPTSCMLRISRLIECVYKFIQMRDRRPCLALYSPGGRVTSVGSRILTRGGVNRRFKI
jgi:hypothetical protein